jgi:hypothetical protein
VNEPENENARGEYREFNAEEPDCQQEFVEDGNGGKSSLFPFDAW